MSTDGPRMPWASARAPLARSPNNSSNPDPCLATTRTNGGSFLYPGKQEIAVPEELDAAVAENLVSSSMGFLPLTPGKKILCTKRQLQECLLTLAQEAYAMGFLSGQKEQFLAMSWLAPQSALRR